MKRVEYDSLGPVEVEAERLWGPQTQRSLENFPIGEEKMPREIIRAFAILKGAAAEANRRLGVLPAEKAETVEFKLAISQLVSMGNISEARELFYQILKLKQKL